MSLVRQFMKRAGPEWFILRGLIFVVVCANDLVGQLVRTHLAEHQSHWLIRNVVLVQHHEHSGIDILALVSNVSTVILLPSLTDLLWPFVKGKWLFLFGGAIFTAAGASNTTELLINHSVTDYLAFFPKVGSLGWLDNLGDLEIFPGALFFAVPLLLFLLSHLHEPEEPGA